MRRVTHIVFLGSVVLLTLVNVAFSSNKTQTHSPQPNRSLGAFGYWMAGPSNFHASFDPSSPDNWLGGTGNWSNGADWSAGEPGSSSDVLIGTGNDYVTLDVNASINSLTVGGSSGSSTLACPYALNIAGAFTINQTGTLILDGSALTAGGNATNAGTINLYGGFGTILIQANNFTNSGTINLSFAGMTTGNTFINTGNISGVLDDYTSVNSTGNFYNSGGISVYTVTTGGNLTNQSGGVLSAQHLGVNGNLTNQGTIASLQGSFAADWYIQGELINSGAFYSPGATIGSLYNTGQFSGGAQVNGNAYNGGMISENYIGNLSISGNMTNDGVITLTDSFNGLLLQIDGNLTNAGSLYLMDHPTSGDIAGSLNNSGMIEIDGGATFGVGGDITNSGTIRTGVQVGGNSFTGGPLTNLTGGVLSVGGAGDVEGSARSTMPAWYRLLTVPHCKSRQRARRSTRFPGF